MSHIDSLYESPDGQYSVNGTCQCGLGATMEWVIIYNEIPMPRCGKCSRGQREPDGPHRRMIKDDFEFFVVQYIMTC